MSSCTIAAASRLAKNPIALIEVTFAAGSDLGRFLALLAGRRGEITVFPAAKRFARTTPERDLRVAHTRLNSAQ